MKTHIRSISIVTMLAVSSSYANAQVLFKKTYKNPPGVNSYIQTTGNDFAANHITPINIPFVYRIGGTKKIEPSFINAGISWGRVWGRDNQSQSLSRFAGFGGMIGLANVTYNAQNNDDAELPTGINNVSTYYGIYLVCSKWGVQFIVACGGQTAIGAYSDNWLNQNKPWIGFGFGLSLYKPQ